MGVWNVDVPYTVTGDGEPVVLLHGLSGSGRWWAGTIPVIAERYRVYTFDLPGFGGMRRAGALPLVEASAWLGDCVDALDIGPVHLAGHSMGGTIAVMLAATRPSVLRRLILVSAAWMTHGPGVSRSLIPLLRASLVARTRFLPVVLLDALRARPTTIVRTGLDLLRADLAGYVPAVRLPTLLIWGENDPLVPLAVGEAFRDAIPTSRLVVLPGAGHIPMVERPEEFNRALLAFLGGGVVGDASAPGDVMAEME